MAAKTIDADAPVKEPSLLKGVLAGVVGGLAGSAAKLMAEAVIPPRVEGQIAPPALMVEHAVGHPLDAGEEAIATKTIHWSFGVLAGAAYGGVVEFHPEAAAWGGVAFGLALNKMTHEGLLPKAALAAEPKQQPMQERLSEWVSHAVYGAVTDVVRRGVRAGIE